jgi:hypothetical protein
MIRNELRATRAKVEAKMDTETLGTIVFADPVQGRTHNEILAAARAADIPDDLVREIRPRNAFIRAMNDLAKNGAIDAAFRDKFRDDAEAITFAFVVRDAVGEGVGYAPNAVVEYDKKTQAIRVIEAPEGKADDVLRQAQDLILRATTTWQCADVTRLVQRFAARYCRQLPVRAGVSFFPLGSEYAVRALEAFFGALHVPFWTLPVGRSEKNKALLWTEITQDIQSEMTRMQDEILAKQADGSLTKRIAQSRLRELREKCEQYKQLCRATETRLSTLVGDTSIEVSKTVLAADDGFDAVMAAAQSGKPMSPVLLALHDAIGAEEAVDVVADLPAALPTFTEVDEVEEFDWPSI